MLYCDIHTHHLDSPENTITIRNRIIRCSEQTINEHAYAHTYMSVGIHPWYIEDIPMQTFLLEKETAYTEVKAIGEAGIEKLAGPSLDIQQKIFLLQASLAEQNRKPLIIHCVKAWEEIMAEKKRFSPRMPWIIHGFRGKQELAEQLIRQGFYLSFGEKFNPSALIATWPDHLLTETDESESDIQTIYENIALSLSVPMEKLMQQIRENVQIIFSI